MNPKLINKLESIYTRSLKRTKPRHYFAIVFGEFGKELSSPELSKLADIIKKQEPDLVGPLSRSRQNILENIDAITAIIEKKAQVVSVTNLLNLINLLQEESLSEHSDIAIDVCIMAFVEYILPKVKNIHKYFDDTETQQLITITNQIMDAFQQYQIHRNDYNRKLRSSLFYSYHYITTFTKFYDQLNQAEIKSAFSSIQLSKEHEYINNVMQKLNSAVNEYDPDKAQQFGFDVEECKMHVDRVWQFVKKWLSQQPDVSNWISFISRGTAIIVKSHMGEKKFSTKHRTGRFIKAFIKNPYEAITDKLLWKKIECLSEEEELDGKQIKQLTNTYKSVNKELNQIGLTSAFQRTTPEEDAIQKLWLRPSLQVK